jgi:hypothetical protein
MGIQVLDLPLSGIGQGGSMGPLFHGQRARTRQWWESNGVMVSLTIDRSSKESSWVAWYEWCKVLLLEKRLSGFEAGGTNLMWPRAVDVS